MNGRSALLALLLFAALLCALGWPSPSARRATAAAVVACAAPVLSQLRIADVGRAQLRTAPAEGVRRSGEHVSSDAELTLRADGTVGALVVALSVRRDVYLPFVTFVAASCAAPVSLRRRGLALLLGLPLALLAGLGSLLLTVRWLFAHNFPQRIAGEERELLDLLVGMLLMPSSVRFAAPMLFATACAAVSVRLTRTRSAVATVSHAHHDQSTAEQHAE